MHKDCEKSIKTSLYFRQHRSQRFLNTAAKNLQC